MRGKCETCEFFHGGAPATARGFEDYGIQVDGETSSRACPRCKESNTFPTGSGSFRCSKCDAVVRLPMLFGYAHEGERVEKSMGERIEEPS